jgi:hypothetical protein
LIVAFTGSLAFVSCDAFLQAGDARIGVTSDEQRTFPPAEFETTVELTADLPETSILVAAA